MIERTFIEDQELVAKILEQLDSTRATTGYNLEQYIDKKAGQLWESYEFELDGNEALGLRKYPYPDIYKIIEIALISTFMDEVAGACALLHQLEWNNRFEFREILLNEIYKRINSIEEQRMEIIFERTELSDFSNKRDVLGKTIYEVEDDAQYFQNLTKFAIELKKKVTSANHLKQ